MKEEKETKVIYQNSTKSREAKRKRGKRVA